MILLTFQYRINLIPRTYDKAIPEGKDRPFTMTSNFPKEFGHDYTGMLGKQGQTIIHRNMDTYAVMNSFIISIQKTYNERREKEEYYQTHKREFADKKIMPKWDPASFAAREFSQFPQD